MINWQKRLEKLVDVKYSNCLNRYPMSGSEENKIWFEAVDIALTDLITECNKLNRRIKQLELKGGKE